MKEGIGHILDLTPIEEKRKESLWNNHGPWPKINLAITLSFFLSRDYSFLSLS